MHPDRSRREALTSANTPLERGKAKFEVLGMEMIEKPVAKCGKSGRVYLPLDWVGKSIKIIRVD